MRDDSCSSPNHAEGVVAAPRPVVGVAVSSLLRAGYKACTRDDSCSSPNHAEGLVAAPRPAVGIAVASLGRAGIKTCTNNNGSSATRITPRAWSPSHLTAASRRIGSWVLDVPIPPSSSALRSPASRPRSGLARRGIRVVVFERDRLLDAADMDAAFAAHRSGVPQFRHSHIFRARTRGLLADNAPDVLDALLAAGARIDTITGMLPPVSRTAAPARATSSSAICTAGAPRSSWPCAPVRARPTRAARRRDGRRSARRARVRPRRERRAARDRRARRHGHGDRRERRHRRQRQALPAAKLARGARRAAARGPHPSVRDRLRLALVPPPRGCARVRTRREQWGRALARTTASAGASSPATATRSRSTMTVPLGDRSLLRARRGEHFDAIAATVPDMVHGSTGRAAVPRASRSWGGLVNRRRALAGADGRAAGDRLSRGRRCAVAHEPLAGLGQHARADARLRPRADDRRRRDPFEQAVAEQAFIVHEIDPWYW